jgi:hypothetical protein
LDSQVWQDLREGGFRSHVLHSIPAHSAVCLPVGFWREWDFSVSSTIGAIYLEKTGIGIGSAIYHNFLLCILFSVYPAGFASFWQNQVPLDIEFLFSIGYLKIVVALYTNTHFSSIGKIIDKLKTRKSLYDNMGVTINN